MSESASSISPIATISSYDDLLAACRRQVARLGLNYQILDQVAGYGDGYATKLLAHSEYSTTGGRRTKRHFSPQSFDAYLAALGLELVAIEIAGQGRQAESVLRKQISCPRRAASQRRHGLFDQF